MRTITLIFVAVCFVAAVSAYPAENEELNPVAAAVEQGDVDGSDDRAKRSPQYYGGYGGGYRGGYGGYGGRGYGGGYGRGYGHGGYGRGGYGGGYGRGGYGGYGFYG